MRRDQIQAAFSAAAPHYEQAATAQKWAAETLLSMIPSFSAPIRGLEIGCGTGILTRHLLRRRPGLWRITDLSPAMLDQARHSGTAIYEILDGERDVLPTGHYDLIVSNLVFQWFDDLPAALQRLKNALCPGGILAFSTMGSDSFAEWKAAHQSLGLSCGLPDYPTAQSLRQQCPDITEIQDATFPLDFPHAGLFGKSLKQLGATIPQPTHTPLSAGQMRRLIRHAAHPFTTRYHVLFVVLERGA